MSYILYESLIEIAKLIDCDVDGRVSIHFVEELT
jgi:hypothetical protein